MCNLSSMTRSQDAMRRLFAAARELTGNLPPLPDFHPDQLARFGLGMSLGES